MKSLYESILSSTGAGMSAQLVPSMYYVSASSSFRDIFNMSKMKSALDNTKGSSDAAIIAQMLCTFQFTRAQLKPLFEPISSYDTNLDEILKSKFKPYIRRNKEDQFQFVVHQGNSGKDLEIHMGGGIRTILWMK